MRGQLMLLLLAHWCPTHVQAFLPSLVATRSIASDGLHAHSRVSWRKDRCSGFNSKSRRRSLCVAAMARKPPPMPELSEEEMADMEAARIEANRKVEEYVAKVRAEREAHRAKEEKERRDKVVQRIEAEKEEAAHKKTYIPQRLEEIEKEEEALKDRVSAFNDKVKDTEIRQL